LDVGSVARKLATELLEQLNIIGRDLLKMPSVCIVMSIYRLLEFKGKDKKV